jgi:dihydrofolate synthase/folylpolyglutamate synthase
MTKTMEANNNTSSNDFTEYEQNLRKLYHIDNVKRGLQNMQELNDALGRPLDDPNITVIHVAGTNGKGSVALKIAKSLELAGRKVGLLISPHIASYRERISINGELISESQVNKHLQKIFNLCGIHNDNGDDDDNEKNDEKKNNNNNNTSPMIPATFFEITTGLSFSYFVESGVDVVVLETGLGGRLDATNVITKPNLCIVTSIGLEHTAILGDTVELIAVEKAGIIKKDVPILVGPNVPHDVIRNCAKEKGAQAYYTCEDVLGKTNNCHNDGIIILDDGTKYVDYDVENSRVATAALELLSREANNNNKSSNNSSNNNDSLPLKLISKDHIERGTSQRPSCRFEEIQTHSIKVILDIAHNPPAMKTLIAKLQVTYPKQSKRIVVGFSADKDVAQCSQMLLSIVKDPSRIHLVEAVNLRAAKIQSIIDADPQMKNTNFDVEDRSITAQVELASALAKESGEILIVCGSVFLMSEAREALGIDEPRDSKRITSVAGSGLLKCKQRLLLNETNTKKS